MKLLKKQHIDTARCFTLNDGSKVFGKMLSVTETEKLRLEVRSRATSDEASERLFRVGYLQKALMNWEGFTYDDGTEIPFDAGVVEELYEANPRAMGGVFSVISNEFAHLAQAIEKNSEPSASVR